MKSEEDFITSILFEAQGEYNKKNYKEALNIVSLLLTKNYKILSLRAKIYYNQSEYYKSLKDCEECINLAPKDNNNLDIYQLQVLNYIKMFDLEKAKVILKECQNISKNNPKNEELLSLIQQEEQNNNINLKKYPQYSIYLKFMKNFYKLGLYLNKVEIGFNSDCDRFCKATEEIFEKDIIIRIPLEALITLDLARQSQLGKYFTPQLEKKLNSPHHSLLSTFMLTEIDKGSKSKWKYYFDFLPVNYNNFPIFYGDREFNYLKGTQFLELIKKKKREMKEDYDLLINVIPGYAKYDFNLFKKMREVISSRVFGVTIKGKKNDIIAPYADMLNHKRPRQTQWNFDDDSNCFIIKGVTNVKKGQEVFDSYGIKCNSRFLLNYGFTVENNEDNEFKIVLMLNENSPLFKEKMEYLGNKNYSKKFSLVINNNSDSKIIPFFSFMRFIFYNKSNFKDVDTSKPISIQNEIILFTKLKELMKNYLSKYPTNLEDDIEYLNKNKKKMDFNEYNCYIIRIGEKKILNYYLNMANDILKLLNTNKSDVKKLFKNLNGKVENKNSNNININNEDNNKFVNNLLKYKNYLSFILPLLIIN
jgi:histone-lysine N-methyltransferase SETD3